MDGVQRTEIRVQRMESRVQSGPVRTKRPFFFKANFFARPTAARPTHIHLTMSPGYDSIQALSDWEHSNLMGLPVVCYCYSRSWLGFKANVELRDGLG